jgi:hypothetical protein
MDFAPLHSAGFKDIDSDQFENIFLEPFDNRSRREYLLSRFAVLLERFKSTGLSAEVWIDGSFSTLKPEPGDIDVIFFVDPNDVNQLAPDKQQILIELNNRDHSKIRYNCDVFILPNNNQNNRSYWRGWFGFSREEEPKGIFRLFI